MRDTNTAQKSKIKRLLYNKKKKTNKVYLFLD